MRVAGIAAPEQRARLLAPFQQISIPPALAAKDWVGSPQPFLAELTAYLWSSSQIDAYRRAAQDLLAVPLDQTPQKSRLAIVIVGKDASRLARSSFASSRRMASRCTMCNGPPETPQHLHAALQQHAGVAGGTIRSLVHRWRRAMAARCRDVDLLSYASSGRSAKTCWSE